MRLLGKPDGAAARRAKEAMEALRIGSVRLAIPNQLMYKLVEAALILASTYIILLVIKMLLIRMQRREIVSGAVVEQVHRLLSITLYSIAVITIIYTFTSAHELFYTLLVILAAILFSNWRLLADVTAYYVIVTNRHLQRGTGLVEFPRLGVKGKLVDITPFSVKLRTTDGRIIYIPNSLVLSEVRGQLTTIQTPVKLRVTLHSNGRWEESIHDLERRLRQALEESHVIPRLQDTTIIVETMDTSKVIFTIEAPVAGAEPRPATINTLVSTLYERLSVYKPHIEVLALPTRISK